LLSGIIPALLTPFTPDNRVDEAGLDRLIAFLLDHGVDGLYLCGSTGEGLLLTEEERCQVVEVALRAVAGRVPVIVHVGALSTGTAERLAAHAHQAGAAAVAAVPPFYFPVGKEAIQEHFRRISRAARLPLYVYNIPTATVVNVGATLVGSLFHEGTIQGVKYTAYDLLAFREIIETCGPGLNIFAGPDEILLPFLLMGAHGGIGTTPNCLPGLFVRLYAAWREGRLEEAQRLQFQVDRLVLLLGRYGVIPATKAVMGFLGLPCGEPRAPLLPLTPAQKTELKTELERLGFFEWVVGHRGG